VASGISQSNFLNLGIEKFGLNLDEPFHKAWNMYQDSLGRIVAYTNEQKYETLTYDGTTFTKKQILPASEKLLMRSDNGGYWKLSDAFKATYVKGKNEVTIDVRKYLERNICYIYKYQGYHYLLTNDGYIKFTLEDDIINVIEHHQYPVTRINYAHFAGDTIFIEQDQLSAYILQSDPDHINYIDDHISEGSQLWDLTNGRVLIESHEGRTIVSKNSNIYRYLTGYGKYFNAPFLDSKGRLWNNQRATDAMGLYVLLPDSDLHQKIDIDIERTNLLRCFEDNLGDIWIMSSTQGIVHLFDQSIRLINKSTGTKTDNISAIYQSPKTGKIYASLNYQNVDILTSDGTAKVDNISMSGSSNAILVDKKDRMWIISGGVYLVENNKAKKQFTKKDGFHSGTVTALFEDSTGEIWAGTRQVLHQYKDDRFVKFQIPGLDVYDKIIGVAELDNTDLLLAIDNGTYYTFDRQKFSKLSVPIMIPNALFTDQEGVIWLGTEDSGLFYFQDQEFIAVAANNHLQLPIRNLQDSDNGLLFGLCAGNKIFYLSKANAKTDSTSKSVRWLTTEGGLPLMDAERRRSPSTALLQSGEVAFPNVYGAIVIDPSKILAEKDTFKLAIFNNDVLVNNDDIDLEYGYNDITLELSNIYLNPQASFRNQYRIDNGDWIDIPMNQNLKLTQLPHGNNSIDVRAKHINGQWLSPVNFSINVPALFYQRWWFLIGAPLFLGLLVYLYVRYMVRSVNARNEWLKTKVDEQTDAIIQEKQQLSESLQKQRELTKELNLSQASKNRMYAQISHEFKSPLQAINAHLNKGTGYIQGQDKDRIKGNIQNLLNISNEIMELSKAESGNLKVKKNWYNINGVINDQVELKIPLAEKKKIKITHPAYSDPQYLEFDISLIQKVLGNLLSNAIKFSPEGGTITIESNIEGQQQVVKISDQGPGIPENEIENLTLAYYQATNNEEDGTGIGLSLVKEILKLHDSHLEIESTLGQGSIFGFQLERSTKSQDKILSENVNSKLISLQANKILDPNKPIILAVDDSLDVLYFINRSLSHKYNVVTTENGMEAINALEQITPSAIISDYNMPIMNGMELLKNVRKNPAYLTLPFLILTGSSSEETELQSITAGADLILQKPIQEEMLVTKVKQLLNRQQSISDSLKTSFAHDLLPTNIHNDDLLLMNELEAVFLEHIDNGKLKSAEIAAVIGLGEKTLRNRVKGITGLTIKEYFRNFRLKKAKLLLDEGYGTMGEVAVATGFSSLSYFSKCYKKYFVEKE